MVDISVIIPTFDRSELLNRAVDSVVQQTSPAQEIIVVDNGLEDAVVHSCNRSSIQLIKTAPRLGPGRSRNAGARAAQSEFLAFLDDDDIWEPDYLEHSRAILEKGKADVVVGQLKRVGADGKPAPYKMFPSDMKKQRSVYFRSPGFGGQNIVIKKELFFKVGGFDEEMPASVDRDLAAKIIEAGGSIVPQPLSVAVLCDHGSERVRDSIVQGNRMFIRKHWRKMSWFELAKACRAYLKRRRKLQST